MVFYPYIKRWINLILEGINDNIEISNNTIIDYDIKYTEFKRDIIDIVIRIIIGVFAYWTNWNISRIYSQ